MFAKLQSAWKCITVISNHAKVLGFAIIFEMLSCA